MAKNNFSGVKFLQVPKVVIYPAAESSSSSRTQTYPVVNECTLDPGLLLYIALLCAEDCSLLSCNHGKILGVIYLKRCCLGSKFNNLVMIFPPLLSMVSPFSTRDL